MDDNQIMQIIMQLQQEVAEMRTDIRGAFKRLDEQRGLLQTVHDLTVSMREICIAQKHMAEEIKRLRTDVDLLRMKPAARWEALVAQVLSLVMAAVMGALSARLF